MEFIAIEEKERKQTLWCEFMVFIIHNYRNIEVTYTSIGK